MPSTPVVETFNSVDTYNFASCVYKSSARVTRVDSRVGLYNVHGPVVHVDRSVDRADYPLRYASEELESHRVTDSYRAFADYYVIRIAQRRDRQLFSRLDFYYCDIALRVSADNRSRKFRTCVKYYAYGRSAFDYVIICNDIAVLR